MMKCKFCGNDIPENEQYCPHCGRDNSVDNVEKKDYTPLIIVAVLILVTIAVVCFGIYENKKAEQRVMSVIRGGKPLEETIQESSEEFNENVDDLLEELDQKTKELNEPK